MNFEEIIHNRDCEKSRQISTKLGVPICLFSKFSRLVPEFGGLGYFTTHSSPPSSGTNLPIFKIGRLVPELGTNLSTFFRIFVLNYLYKVHLLT